MTSSEMILAGWATHPLGKVARIGIAVGGMIIATLVLLMSTLLSEGVWLFVLAGVSTAAASIRAAQYPTLLRLSIVSVSVLIVPLIAQLV